MFYQLTPPRKIKKKINKIESPKEEVYFLSLAPFSSSPKICFENCKLGEIYKKKLIINNPTSILVDVIITKPPELVSLEWNDADIKAGSDLTLELSWSPQEYGSFRDTFTIQNSRTKIPRVVNIILKTVDNNNLKKINRTKSKTTLSYVVKKTFLATNTKSKNNSFNRRKSRSPIRYTNENDPNPINKQNFFYSSNKKSPNLQRTFTIKKDDQVYLRQNDESNSLIRAYNEATLKENKNQRVQILINNDNYKDSLEDSFEIDKIFNNQDKFIDFDQTNLISTMFDQIRTNNALTSNKHQLNNLLSNDQINREHLSFFNKIDSSAFSGQFDQIRTNNFAFTPDKNHSNYLLSNDRINQEHLSFFNKIDSSAFNLNVSLDAKNVQTNNLENNNAFAKPMDFKSVNISPISKSSSKDILCNDKNNDRMSQSLLSSTQKELNFTGGESTKIHIAPTMWQLDKNFELLNKNEHKFELANFQEENFKYLSQTTNSNQLYDSESVFKKPVFSNNQFDTKYKNKSQQVMPYHTNRYSIDINYPRNIHLGNGQHNNNFQFSKTTFIKNDHVDQTERELTTSTPFSKLQFFDDCLEPIDLSKKKPNVCLNLYGNSNQNENTLNSDSFISIRSDLPNNISLASNQSLSTTKQKMSPLKRKTIFISNYVSPPKRLRRAISTNNVTWQKFSAKKLKRGKKIDSDFLADRDPFLSNMYFDEELTDKYVNKFVKWLNILLTPSIVIDSTETKKIDIGKLFREIKSKELVIAPSKEALSLQYLSVANRLNTLRKAALNLFKSPEVEKVLTKVSDCIEKKRIAIRKDRNLHLDILLQKNVMELLLKYNPLWLRIGLEVIYNETIPLKSNTDIVTLSKFIFTRLFQNPFLSKKLYKTKNYQEAYAEALKVFILKKFIYLVYFLDLAKMKKIVSHDPCLFRPNTDIKDSKQVLLIFSKELLSSLDIAKSLKDTGLVLSYKQTPLDEYDYSVKNLGCDLRDGIRLTRIIEILLMDYSLSSSLRVPCVSRLQKIYNVNVALQGLKNGGFVVNGNIDANDIVNGHREKTLSLIWQIINKFESPYVINTAKTIQKWWRSLPMVVKRITLKRKFEEKELTRKNNAAKIIQKFMKKSCKMLKCKREFLRQKNSAILIQHWYKTIKQTQKLRDDYTRLKKATIFIQTTWRNKRALNNDRRQFLQKIAAIKLIQRNWRAKKIRNDYLKLKSSVVLVQNRFKAKQLMIKQRDSFLKLKKSAIILQNKWRATLLMRNEMLKFTKLKLSVIFIQLKFRANLQMRIERKNYEQIRAKTIFVQRQYRALIKMRKQRSEYINLRNSTVLIQQRYRAILKMRYEKVKYENLKKSAIVLQRRFRAQQKMRLERDYYQKLKKYASIVQNKFRALVLMKKENHYYKKLKQSTIIIQQKWRAILQQRKLTYEYNRLKKATVLIQNRFRANKKMEIARRDYLQILNATKFLQQKWRAKCLMKKLRNEYLSKRQATLVIQKYYRANRLMIECRTRYLLLKSATIKIQQKFRANKQMERLRNDYNRLKTITIFVQNRFRANILMKKCRNDYLILKERVIFVQTLWRSKLLMRKEREHYLKITRSIKIIQNWFKAVAVAKQTRLEFLKIKQATIVLQTRFRARQMMLTERENYQTLKRCTIFLQKRYRQKKLAEKEHNHFIEMKQSAIILQRYWRTRQIRKEFMKIKTSVCKIQFWWRQILLLRRDRERYLKTLSSIEKIQKWYRSKKLVKNYVENFKKQLAKRKIAAIKIQALWRGYSVRKNYEQNTELKTILNRIEIANKNYIESNSIGKRLNKIIQCLFEANSIDYLLDLLEVIEFLTSLTGGSLAKSESNQQAEKLIFMLYKTLNSLNRSIMEIKASTLIFSILINLVRTEMKQTIYDSNKNLAEEVFQIISHVMQYSCDKDGDLFNYAATFLYLILENEEQKELFKMQPKISLIFDKMNEKVKRWYSMKLNTTKMPLKSKKMYSDKNDMVVPTSKNILCILSKKDSKIFKNRKFALECILKRAL